MLERETYYRKPFYSYKHTKRHHKSYSLELGTLTPTHVLFTIPKRNQSLMRVYWYFPKVDESFSKSKIRLLIERKHVIKKQSSYEEN